MMATQNQENSTSFTPESEALPHSFGQARLGATKKSVLENPNCLRPLRFLAHFRRPIRNSDREPSPGGKSSSQARASERRAVHHLNEKTSQVATKLHLDSRWFRKGHLIMGAKQSQSRWGNRTDQRSK